MGHWNHRIVKQVLVDGEETFTFAEVFYNDAGQPYGWTRGAADDLDLKSMMMLKAHLGSALDKPTLTDGDFTGEVDL